jgi:two-component system cell cycle sensor histidine kinase/response regulator CckA
MSGISDGDIRCDIATTEEHLLSRASVLIVEDDDNILELASEILRTLGYDVLTARSGLEALPILRSNPHLSILFTDIQMPHMGGEELAEIASALRPDIPVIFTSGCGVPRTAAPFLQKPYKAADLVRVLASQPPPALRSCL